MGKYTIKKKVSPLNKQASNLEKYDWPNARRDYIEGIQDEHGVLRYPKNAEVCEKYGIPSQSLSNKINKERWVDHRKALERERLMEIQKERMKKLSKNAVILDQTGNDIAQTGMKIILERLVVIDSLQQSDRTRIMALKDMWDNGEIIDEVQFRKDIRPWMYHEEISELAKAFEKFHEGGRRALGIKDDESGTVKQSVHVEIGTMNVNEELGRDDSNRNEALLSILRNKNLVIPGVTDQILDAEIVEEPLELTTGADDD